MSDPIQHLGLLCIDLQDTFLKAIPEQEALIHRCRFAIEAAKLLGVSVAATEQRPEKLGATSAALTGSFPEDTPVFDKAAFSALEAEGLDRWIESNQIDHLLLMGIEVPICIYQTAVQAMGEDLGVTLLSDCVSQRRPEDREAVFQQLLAMEAHILPSETIFYSLLGSADHPLFRDYTKLVKAATA
ncbi:isochorismatase [Coraliomargarita sinensis]|uniref:Isochorismatase n=1 Tax=Coraliomargarita sinensis TaxID=2174842 RepID=A0A317ZH13_9BACT|nr:isochorismatase family protein [Coraliomargarita sinensis]PXA03248.1 isochorismatase [Coraliomargarita sinensis]